MTFSPYDAFMNKDANIIYGLHQDMNYDLYPRDTWLEVNLGQFENNVKIIQKTAGKRVLVVVKANAYGHGLVPCGLAAERAGAAMLGVATVGEAALLRRAGVEIPILRMTAYGLAEVKSFIEQDVDFFVWTVEQIREADKCAHTMGKKARVHLKIDTGMGRAGVFVDDMAPIVDEIKQSNNLIFAGVCSHFHSADADDTFSTEKQINIFNNALKILEEMDVRPDYIHLANSPGLLRFEHARYNMVRSGVITYGLFYERGYPLPDGVKPIAQWKARVVSVKTLPAHHGVGYGVRYQTPESENIAILPVGYADGFHRFPDNVNEVLLNSRRVRVVGRVCMDQCMLKIPHEMHVQVGDEAVLIGRQGDNYLEPLDIADKWGTNNYDVLANIDVRVPRVYVL